MSKRYEKSKQMLERAKLVTPLGAQTYSKSYRYFCQGVSPSFIEKGKGCRVWDVDGNEFIDFIAALGPITVGYADDRVNQAVYDQLQKGIVFSQPSPISIDLAEKLVSIIPCAEMVRFVKNGSDATTAAVKLSRAYTGKKIVLASGYHGMQDWYIGATENNVGVPEEMGTLTKLFTYNDKAEFDLLTEQFEGQIAAIILEPFQGNGPESGFLEYVREKADMIGAVLIFDEVKSGFWFALGGYSEYCGVTPDVATFGKGMANGMPISVIAGKKEILELIESKKVFISTTFGGEALSMAGAIETIRILEEEDAYEHIWRIGNMLFESLQHLIEEEGVEEIVHVKGAAPYCGLEFGDYEDVNYLTLLSVYQKRMIDEGILTLGINHINLSHTEEDIRKYIDASKLAFEDIKMFLGSDRILPYGAINHVFQRNK